MNLNLLGNLSFKVSLIKWPTVDGRRITVQCTPPRRAGQVRSMDSKPSQTRTVSCK